MSLTAPGTPADAPEPALVAPLVRPRLGRGRALIEVLLCSGLLTQAAVAGVLGLLGFRPQAASGQLEPTFVFLLSLGDALLLVGLIVWLLRLNGERPWDVIVGARPWRPEVLRGIAIAPLILLGIGLLLAILQRVAPWLHNVTTNPLGAMLQSPAQIAMFAVVVLVAGAVREEVQRAFLLHRFTTHLGGPALGLAITSLAFGLGHSLQGWDATIATGVMGAIWGALYLARRSAVAPMTSHALFNLAELARGVVTGQL
jgi:membrane protease YdiL (CAAX protease family)